MASACLVRLLMGGTLIIRPVSRPLSGSSTASVAWNQPDGGGGRSGALLGPGGAAVRSSPSVRTGARFLRDGGG